MDYIVPLPPKHVPGPVKQKARPPSPPPAPPRGVMRIHFAAPWPARGSSLKGISMIYYGTDTRWVEIYNANRIGIRRPDGSPGFMSNPNYLAPGAKVWVP